MQSAGSLLLLLLILIVVVPSGYNLFLLFRKPLQGKSRIIVLILELICIAFGAFCTLLACSAKNIEYKDWSEQLYNLQKHTPIMTEAFPTFLVIIGIALVGYLLLQFIKLDRMPPLCAVLCISALYLGIILCIVWCVQISKDPPILLYILPLNLIVIFMRAIRNVVLEQSKCEAPQGDNPKFLNRIFQNAKNWPWIALILMVPLLGLLIMVLILFGQKPDDIIRMWTETADWTMSTKIPPQNIFYDEHYLCTVAAGGHRKVVKPLRTGMRHGHRVVVNRQLMIANAFEQLIQERTPRFHKTVRTAYDKMGYPIAKHIHSPILADIIYFVMKPLEWLFLIVLYLFDQKPENRIAVQYPHSKPPIVK